MNRSLRPSNVEIRADDPALTSHAGLLLTGELVARMDLVTRLDRAIDAVRPFKVRRRGRSGGELLVALAELMVVGGDHLLHLDELREDKAGAELRAVGEVPAPTTAGQLMRRLNARQCQAAVTELAKIAEEVDHQLGLTANGPVTLDLDSFDSEVYGRRKQGAAFNHRGQRCYDTQLATWAERRRILAAELRSGNLNESGGQTGLGRATRGNRRAIPLSSTSVPGDRQPVVRGLEDELARESLTGVGWLDLDPDRPRAEVAVPRADLARDAARQFVAGRSMTDDPDLVSAPGDAVAAMLRGPQGEVGEGTSVWHRHGAPGELWPDPAVLDR